MVDKLKASAIAFERLLKYEDEIVAGSKKTLLEMTLFFEREHFMHLIGLHKLTDLQIQRFRKEQMYDMVMRDELTYDYIEKSVFFSEIKERIELFPILETALDSNELLIKYKHGVARGTVIRASYIIIYNYGDVTIHYFVDQDEKTNRYFGKSFFGRSDDKFLRNQQTFKVLKLTKYDKEENSRIILKNKRIKV